MAHWQLQQQTRVRMQRIANNAINKLNNAINSMTVAWPC